MENYGCDRVCSSRVYQVKKGVESTHYAGRVSTLPVGCGDICAVKPAENSHARENNRESMYRMLQATAKTLEDYQFNVMDRPAMAFRICEALSELTRGCGDWPSPTIMEEMLLLEDVKKGKLDKFEKLDSRVKNIVRMIHQKQY